MIPSRDQLCEAYEFFARRARLEERARKSPIEIELPLQARPVAVEAALKMAERLIADDGVGEVAAILYSFARHPRSFPFGLIVFTTVIAKNVASSRGTQLAASAEEFRDLIVSVTENRATVMDVTAWVDLRSSDL